MPIYSDMKTGLDITSGGNVDKVYDVDVVVQSIKTILATVSGERVRNPIGAGVVRYLFQSMNVDVARQIRNEIAMSINTYEPRVLIENISVVPVYDGNYYNINIIVAIKGIKAPAQINYRMRSFSSI